MSFRIRPAARADLDAIVELCSRFSLFAEDSRGHVPFDASTTSACLVPLVEHDRFGIVLVAEHVDASATQPGLFGYLVLTWGYSLESGGREALIDELYVEPKGRGVGSALVDAAVVECEQRGLRRMFLETEVDNERARSLYIRNGFGVDDSIWMSRWMARP